VTEKYHFIGIGGIGMSGLATILLEKKIMVSGSDISSTYITDRLKSCGAEINLGHDACYIKPGMTVVFSTDIKENNPEYMQAISLKCPIFHRSDFLGKLMEGYKSLAITGTHGKTTTTALLAWVLFQAGLDPAFAIGGVLPQLQTNARHGSGAYFIAEADESDGSFLKYPAYGAIITNVDLDHMDYFQSEERLIKAFKKFIEGTNRQDLLFWCYEDEKLRKIQPKGISYGFEPDSLLKGSSFRQEGWAIEFDVTFENKSFKNVKVPLIGRHNALNALAVFGLALKIGIKESKIRKAFDTFCGVARRCERKGEKNGVLIIDDYAHHPTEIQTTLRAIRHATEARRLVAVFQPHRFSRTKNCLGLYGKIFNKADFLVLTDIYGAGEKPIEGLSVQQIFSEIRSASSISCQYVERQNLVSALQAILRPNDVLVTLGAGDITYVGSQLLNLL
jgi:UDP-N-acetylmuramate--alanine ligase